MANFKLKMTVDSRNFESIYELRARLSDFTLVLSNIVAEWARGNKRKFLLSRGAELSGTTIPPADWDGVTERYYDEKHGPVKRGDRMLYPDWLMVRTGSLRDSLVERGGFGELIDNASAVFGTPLDEEDAVKAAGNFKKRPTIFLSESDRLMIRREFQNYLNFGENYRELMFARAGDLQALKDEITLLDAEYRGAVG